MFWPSSNLTRTSGLIEVDSEISLYAVRYPEYGELWAAIREVLKKNRKYFYRIYVEVCNSSTTRDGLLILFQDLESSQAVNVIIFIENEYDLSSVDALENKIKLIKNQFKVNKGLAENV